MTEDVSSLGEMSESSSAVFAFSMATNCLLLRPSFSISIEKSRDVVLSNSSAKFTNPMPVSNSMALFGLVDATRYRRISGGTRESASSGPIVFPDEEDIAP